MNVLRHFVSDSSPTYYVIQLHTRCSDSAAQFIHDQLVLDWAQGGGGLDVRRQLPTQAFPETLLHVSASNNHLLHIADSMQLRKEDKEGFIRPYCKEEDDAFPGSGRVGPLHLADVHRCVQHAMDRVHFSNDILHLPGHDNKAVMRGAPVLSSYQERRLVTVFPLHDDEDLDRLYKQWNTFSPPLEGIRNYFGESVALYWSFAETYTRFLTLVAALGATEFFCEYHGINYIYSNLLFGLFNLVCLAVFFEVWKRKANGHSFFWGTSGKLRRKPPRPEYRGELAPNPVTGRQEMYYPSKDRVKKIVFASVPITMACLLIAFVLMVSSFEADRILAEFFMDPESGEPASDLLSKILLNLPSIAYSLSILVFNKLYLKLARRLTTWENHRTDEQHDTHITLKLITFEFVNTFMALFYLGFYLQDLAGLRSQLFTTLLVQQIVNQVQEVLVPLLLHKTASNKFLHKIKKSMGGLVAPETKNVKNVSDLGPEDERVKRANHDTLAEPLDTLHDDFMELWLQFGHVFLFSAVYPLAGCFAFANNLTELFADRYKLCRLSRKPRSLAVRDIGAWYHAFRLTALLSILSNLSLLALDLRDTAGQDWGGLQWAGLFVVIEHVFLVLFLGVNQVISDTPKEVKLAQDKTNFHFKHMHVKQ